MFALGEVFTGPNSVALSLAKKVLPQAEVLDVARAAPGNGPAPPGSLMATKKLMRDSALLARIKQAGAIFAKHLHSNKQREAFAAFAARLTS